MVRNFILFTLFVLQTFSLNRLSYGQEKWVPFTRPIESKPIFDLQSSSIDKVLFLVETPGMLERSIFIQGKYYYRLTIIEQNRSTDVGYPEIPVISQLIGIPDCAKINLTTNPLDSIYLENHTVYPVPRLVERHAPDGYAFFEEEFTINDSVYSIASYYPNKNAKIAELGSIRDQSVARIEIFPIQFDPVKSRLKIYTRIQVALDFDSPKSTIIKDVGPFDKACKSAILNYK